MDVGVYGFLLLLDFGSPLEAGQDAVRVTVFQQSQSENPVVRGVIFGALLLRRFLGDFVLLRRILLFVSRLFWYHILRLEVNKCEDSLRCQ